MTKAHAQLMAKIDAALAEGPRCGARAMMAESLDDIEIPVAIADAIASWRRVFHGRNGADAHVLLRQAAGDLWQTLEIDRTVHPESHAIVRQEVVDALQGMAESSGIGPDDAQLIFAESFNGKGEIFDAPEATPDRNGGAPASDSLRYIDVTRRPIPAREWAVPDRIPARNVALLSGEGAVGKSLLLLQLSVAHVLARDWFGTMPKPGPVMYLSCEDDDDEICRRLEAIAEHYGASRDDLKEHLHVLSFAGRDAALAVADRSGRMCPTPLFEQFRRGALQIQPRLIGIDTVADVFAGNENDRAQTRQFVTLLRGSAIETGAAVALVSHPSLTGISTGTGLSGSTAWHNSVRARMYLKSAETGDDKVEGPRMLEFMKNNYGPISERIALRWRGGVFVPEPTIGSFEKMAADTKIDTLFLELLRRLTKQGRNVSYKKSPSYAPTIFEREPEASKDKISRKQLAEAMTRLFAANKLVVVTEGSQSHPRSRIVEAERDASN